MRELMVKEDIFVFIRNPSTRTSTKTEIISADPAEESLGFGCTVNTARISLVSVVVATLSLLSDVLSSVSTDGINSYNKQIL